MRCGQTFILNIQMVAKLKTLKFTRLNKLFSYEVIQLWYREKPKFLRHLTEWIVRGTGIEPIENVMEKKNSWNLCYIFPFSIQLVDIVVWIVSIIILVDIVVFNWFSITLLVCVLILKV